MKVTGDNFLTPIYLKTEANMASPQDAVYHLFGGNGHFLGRNNRFFESCVPAGKWPGELAPHQPYLQCKIPRIPRPLLELVIGFFAKAGEQHNSEAAVLLAWNEHTETMEPVVPKQVGTVSKSWYGDTYPLDLTYEIPKLPPHLTLLGDIHSHVDGPAYASLTDKADEVHRPGLHLVVGRIWDEPPQFHCEFIVDGYRFPIKDLSTVCQGYARRAMNFPPEWMDQLTVKSWSYTYKSSAADGGNGKSLCAGESHQHGNNYESAPQKPGSAA